MKKKEQGPRVDHSQYRQPLATAGTGSRSPRGFCVGRRPWTAAEDAVIRQRYANEPTEAVANDLDRSTGSTYQRAYAMGLKKSAAYLASPASCRLHFGETNSGVRSQFPKGHLPANKGLRRPGWGPGRMKATQFKSGTRSGEAAKNWKPIGTILTDADGYQRIKVREWHKGENFGFGNTKIWPLLQRHVWEQAHGSIPPGHAVCFKDGNKANCAIENLELLTRAALMKRNSVHNLPKPLAETIQLLGALKRQIRQRTNHAREKQDRRPAQSPVRDAGSAEG